MKINDIIMNLSLPPLTEADQQTVITAICSDSRKVQEGCLFVALPGPKTHGAKFIADAIAAGARAVVCTNDVPQDVFPQNVIRMDVADPQRTLVGMLKNFYRDPSRDMKLIGITGTNGKTTLTYLLESIFNQAGFLVGVIGTVNHRFAGQVFKASNTTPGLVENYEYLAKMVQAKVAYCAMEVSSHALDQRRVEGLDFEYGIFTNLTSDHLDYHKDRDTYFRAKAKLFTALKRSSRAIINGDDEYGVKLQNLTTCPKWTYGIKSRCDISALEITYRFDGTAFKLVGPGGEIFIQTALIGMHNIYNILAASSVAMAERIPIDQIKKGIEALKIVPGRLERVDAGQDFYVFVDYAHTEDALANVLKSLRNVSPARLITVFGCGGDRDKTKRPRMAAVVEELSDWAIITTDNPRSEDPLSIVDDILKGFKNKTYQVVIDREEAIVTAMKLARPGDVVLIAGKGHEDYQIFKDRTIPFDEREVVKKCLQVNRSSTRQKES